MKFEQGKSGNPAGKPKGAVNKTTQTVREVIAAFADEMAEPFVGWVKEVAANGDPHKAAELYLKAIEYHIPKLGRVESQQLDKNGNKADPVSITVNKIIYSADDRDKQKNS